MICSRCKKDKHLDEFTSINAYFCKKCKESKKNEKRKLLRKEFSAKGFYESINRNSKNKYRNKKLFRLDEFKEWFDQQENYNCSYCNITHTKYKEKRIYGKYQIRSFAFTLDRVDSTKPYSLENICICCGLCNYVKGFAFNADDFKEIAKQYIMPLYK